MAQNVNSEQRVSLGKILLIGLAFMTTQILWAHYNSAVPKILQSAIDRDLGTNFALFGFIGVSTLIGFIMTWDNIIAFFFQPYIGVRSDNTRTRFGRRMPYIMVGIPCAAVLFIFIPIAGNIVIWAIIPVLLLFNFSMALYRSPAVSLMPDLVPSSERSFANGAINLMGGLGSAIMFLVGGYLYDKEVIYSFIFGSVLIILLGLLLFFSVKEPKEYTNATLDQKVKQQVQSKKEPGIISQLGMIVQTDEKSQLYMLLAIFFWFTGWNAIEAFFTLYAEELFHVTIGQAETSLIFFTVFFILMALPAGVIGQKIGRIMTMRIGLGMFIIILFAGNFVNSLPIFQFILMGAGLCWALINVNSIVVIWQHARDNGSGTGIYYAFSSLAAIIGPVVSGFLFDQVHTKSILLPFTISMLIVAFLFLLMVRKGEATDVIKKSFYLETADDI